MSVGEHAHQQRVITESRLTASRPLTSRRNRAEIAPDRTRTGPAKERDGPHRTIPDGPYFYPSWEGGGVSVTLP